MLEMLTMWIRIFKPKKPKEPLCKRTLSNANNVLLY